MLSSTYSSSNHLLKVFYVFVYKIAELPDPAWNGYSKQCTIQKKIKFTFTITNTHSNETKKAAEKQMQSSTHCNIIQQYCWKIETFFQIVPKKKKAKWIYFGTIPKKCHSLPLKVKNVSSYCQSPPASSYHLLVCRKTYLLYIKVEKWKHHHHLYFSNLLVFCSGNLTDQKNDTLARSVWSKLLVGKTNG